jgi:hypothetical protein
MKTLLLLTVDHGRKSRRLLLSALIFRKSRCEEWQRNGKSGSLHCVCMGSINTQGSLRGDWKKIGIDTQSIGNQAVPNCIPDQDCIVLDTKAFSDTVFMKGDRASFDIELSDSRAVQVQD